MKLSVFSLLLITSIIAGNEVGNGGDAVVCPGKLPVLLDFQENSSMKSPYKISVRKGAVVDEYKYTEEVFKRLGKVSPTFSKKYLNDLKKLKKEAKFIPQSKFRNIEDSFHISVPKGCTLKQAAIQRQVNPNGETTIFFNKDIFEKMNVHNKAGIISHEIIYEHFRYFGQVHSVNVREFNRYLFSEKLKKGDKQAFTKMLVGMRIPAY